MLGFISSFNPIVSTIVLIQNSANKILGRDNNDENMLTEDKVPFNMPETIDYKSLNEEDNKLYITKDLPRHITNYCKEYSMLMFPPSQKKTIMNSGDTIDEELRNSIINDVENFRQKMKKSFFLTNDPEDCMRYRFSCNGVRHEKILDIAEPSVLKGCNDALDALIEWITIDEEDDDHEEAAIVKKINNNPKPSPVVDDTSSSSTQYSNKNKKQKKAEGRPEPKNQPIQEKYPEVILNDLAKSHFVIGHNVVVKTQDEANNIAAMLGLIVNDVVRSDSVYHCDTVFGFKEYRGVSDFKLVSLDEHNDFIKPDNGLYQYISVKNGVWDFQLYLNIYGGEPIPITVIKSSL